MDNSKNSELIILPNQKAIINKLTDNLVQMNYNDFKFNATIESRLDNYNLSIINLPFLPKKINKFIDLSEGEYIIKNKLVFVDKNNNINNHIFNPAHL